MSALLIALAAALMVVVAAIGAGSFVCVGARSWSPGRRWQLRLLLGLGVLPLLPLLLHELFGTNVRVWLTLLMAAVGWAVAWVQERRWNKGEPTDAAELPVMLVLAGGLFVGSLSGLLAQPGFEGLDPWRHAFSTAWLVDSGILRQPDAAFPLVHYVDAYPPLFDILLALPAALFGGLPAAAKGVAALLVAVAPSAVLLLARALFDEPRRTVVAAVLYALLPSAVSRHLWAHSLAVILLLAGLAAVLELRRDRRWWPAVAVCFGGVMLAAPSQGLKAWCLLALSAVAVAFVDRRWLLRIAVASGAAAVLAAGWLLPAAQRFGYHPMNLVRQMQPPELRRPDHPLTRLDDGREAPAPWIVKDQDHFGWSDVFFFRPFEGLLERFGGKRVNLVVTAGLGLPLVVMLAAGLLVGRGGPPEIERTLAIVWLAVAALFTFGAPLGLTLFPWRSWLLLAPFAAVVAADGVLRLTELANAWRYAAVAVAAAHGIAAVLFDVGSGLAQSQWLRPSWLVVVVACCWLMMRATGGLSMHRRTVVCVLLSCHLAVAGTVRAAGLYDPVPPRVFYDRAEHRGYLQLESQLSTGARVWPLSGGLRFDILVGLGFDCTPFRATELEMARRCSDGVPLVAEEFVSWARDRGYEWLVLDPSFGELLRALDRPDEVERLCLEFDSCPNLQRVVDTTTFVVWRLKD
ncbi:MAG: hypothetical protein V2I67_18140 [Thermoanaerobaculales bacterium]|nr:hypothetical protein [Thermoanaerobaculales bacterium]